MQRLGGWLGRQPGGRVFVSVREGRPVFDGADQTVALEYLAEVQRIRKAHGLGDLLDAQVGALEELCRLLDPFIVEVLLESGIGVFLKENPLGS